MLPTWSARGTCRDEDPELFFPLGYGREFTDQIDQAKTVCRRCPVASECLDDAIEVGHEGIWGGTDEAERRDLRLRRRAQAAHAVAPQGSKPCNSCGETGEDGTPADEQAARRRAALVDA